MFDEKKLIEAYDSIHAPEKTALEVHRRMAQPSRRTKVLPRTAVAVLAAVLTVGTAFAASSFHLLDLIGRKEAPDTTFFEAHIQASDNIEQQAEPLLPAALSFVDIEEETAFSQPLLILEEVYFDGSKLYFYGRATSTGADYNLFTEHIIIDGEQYYVDFRPLLNSQHYYQGNDQPGQDAPEELQEDYETWRNIDPKNMNCYYGQVQLYDKAMAEDFTVELPLFVYGRSIGIPGKITDENGLEQSVEFRSDGRYITHLEEYPDCTLRYNLLEQPVNERVGYQTISFRVSVTDNRAKICPPQTLVLESGDAEVKMLTISPSTTHLVIKWNFYGESAESQVRKMSTALLSLKDSDGNIYDWMENGISPLDGTPSKTKVYQENGGWCTEKEFFFAGIPVNTTALTVIPYGMDENAVDRTGETLSYASFTISIPR